MRKVIAGFVVAAALLGLSGSGVQRAGAQLVTSDERPPLEIRALSVRTFGLREGEVEVAVTAGDEQEIGWVDLDCAGDRRRIDGAGRSLFSVLVRCMPVEGASPEVRATAFSRDGAASGQTAVARLDTSHLLPPVSPSDRRPQKRFLDTDYPARIGAFDDYAEQLVPVLSDDDTPWWRRWVDNPGRKPFDFAAHCGPGIDHVAPDGLALRCWLTLHPTVRENIVWHEYVGPGQPILYGNTQPRGVIIDKLMPYDTWSEDMKIWLDVSVYWAYKYLDAGADNFSGQWLPDVPPNQLQLKDEDGAYAVIAHDDAWKLYLGTIAHSLALEMGNFVPWSIVNYTVADLQVLFHSDFLLDPLKTSVSSQGVTLFTMYGYQPDWVIPAPPTTTFEFFVNNDLIRPTAFATTGRFITWGRYDYHLGHIGVITGVCEEPWTNKCHELFYNYRGTAPIARILAPQGYGNIGWVPACYGMSEIFEDTFRLLNIPVDGGQFKWIKGTIHKSYLGETQHHTPFFWTLGYTLSHGDDVYNFAAKSTPRVPGSWVPITLAKYDEWFYGDDPLAQGGWNIGRQANIELPIYALADVLLQRYCIDKASGAGHADGTVAAYFTVEPIGAAYYTVAELEAMNLWDKLAPKAAALGFCN